MWRQVCRHCGAPGVAADAGVCPACGGWNPNPGVISRMAAGFKTLVALVVLAVAGVFFYQGVMSPDWSDIGHRQVVYAISGGLALFGLGILAWSTFWPYGRPQV